MKLKSIIFIKAFILVGFSTSFAQDLIYSQFNAMPLEVNPAFAGNNACNYRVSAIMRNQWTAIENVNSYKSGSFAADFNLNNNGDSKQNLWGLGFLSTYDQFSTGKFKNIKLIADIAYHIRFGKKANNFLSFGIQAGAAHRSVNTQNFLFGDQIDNYGRIVSTNSTDQNYITNQSIWYPELNFGTLFTLNPSSNANIYLGASIFHLTQPNISFTAVKEKMPTRFNLHGGGYFSIKRFLLLPSGYFQYQQLSNFNVGSYFGYYLAGGKTSTQVLGYLGVWYKSNDAIAVALRTDIGKVSIAFSYDIHTGKISQNINSIGSPELSINLFGCFNHNGNRSGCPSL